MPCRSIADVLRGLGEVPPPEVALVDAGGPEPSQAPGTPWLDPARIRASVAKDVLARLERGCDDRTFEQRSADATAARARTRAAQRVKWRFTFSPKAAAKSRAKKERTDATRAYFREYQRRRRAEAKAELTDVP